MNSKAVAERRKARRVKVNARAATISGGKTMSCRLIDISRLGAAAVVAAKIPELSLVMVDLRLGGGELPTVLVKGQAAVVRCDALKDGTFECGLFFLDLKEETRLELDGFVAASERIDPASAL